MNKKEKLRNTIYYISFIFIIWGLYRFVFRLPAEIEELVIKPVIWLIPIVYFLKKEKVKLSTLGITAKNLIPSVYLAVGLGFVFGIVGVLVNLVKYQGIDFSANIGKSGFVAALLISLVTAITEEISFRGYLFNRVWQVLKKEWLANVIVSILWGLIHLPVVVFLWQLNVSEILIYTVLVTIFGIGSAFIFARTKNIASSILLHVLWQWPIILFR